MARSRLVLEFGLDPLDESRILVYRSQRRDDGAELGVRHPRWGYGLSATATIAATAVTATGGCGWQPILDVFEDLDLPLFVLELFPWEAVKNLEEESQVLLVPVGQVVQVILPVL